MVPTRLALRPSALPRSLLAPQLLPLWCSIPLGDLANWPPAGWAFHPTPTPIWEKRELGAASFLILSLGLYKKGFSGSALHPEGGSGEGKQFRCELRQSRGFVGSESPAGGQTEGPGLGAGDGR